MRGFFILLIGLFAGMLSGIVLDRAPQTRPQVTNLYNSVPLSLPGQAIPFADPTYRDFGPTPYDTAALATYNLAVCFSEDNLRPHAERPWRDRGSELTRQGDLPPALPIPDLANYPGLIKIEAITSERGSNREHCGATRVSEHWFLTAAHCFRNKNPDIIVPLQDAIAITPQGDIFAPGTVAVPIRTALCHSEFGDERGTFWQGFSNDIALFYVEDVSAFDAVTVPDLERTELNLRNNAFANAYFSGWGNNGGSRYLQGGPVAVSQFGEALLVTERIGERGPDVGDSGSPLYIDYGEGPLVVGVLSSVAQGAGSANNSIATFVRVKSIRGWLEQAKALCEREEAFVC